MSFIGDAYTLLLRDMLIFKKNLGVNIIRSLIFPLIFIILLGSFGSTPKNVPVAVVNYDNGQSALRFINALESGGSVVVISSTTQTAALNLLSSGKVAGVIVIPPGFSSGTTSTIYIYLDNSQPQSAEVISSQVSLVASEVGASTFISKLSQVDPPSPIKIISNYVYGASSNYLSFVVGGLIVMVAAFGSVFSSGFTLLSDRELGNLKAFLTTPINQFAVLLSKIGYGTFQSFLSAFIGLIIGIIYGATIDAGVLGFFELIWIVFLVGLGFSCLAIALATRMKQLQTYALASQTIVMPLAFLGGAFVPVTLLPSFLLPIAAINPLTYAVNAVRDVMIKGFLPISTLVSTSLILVAFAGAFMVLSLMLFKNTSTQIS